MQIKDAKTYFTAGLIEKIEVRPALYEKGWTVVCQLPRLGGEDIITTALGDIKIFSSLDTLVRQIEQITGRPIQSATLGV